MNPNEKLLEHARRVFPSGRGLKVYVSEKCGSLSIYEETDFEETNEVLVILSPDGSVDRLWAAAHAALRELEKT
jgi:hypothetical protein